MPAHQSKNRVLREPSTLAEWDSYFDLRWRILRDPWGQPRGTERDSLEANAFHLMIVDAHGSALAVGRLHSNTPHEAQVRYMAVDPAYQQSGLGRKILEGLEDRARCQGAKRIILNARDNAVGFYARSGYEAIGPGETLFGQVRHIRMSKSLEPAFET
jgi:N-acetylglutamate synthase-like GNAT family acetyltransferase